MHGRPRDRFLRHRQLQRFHAHPRVLLAVAANAAYASVVLSEFYCRTHLLSRVWVALLAAAGLAWLLERGTAARVAATAVTAVLVALGLRGGLERQDYYAGHWRRHRAELVSLREAAPGLTPDARVLLRLPPHDGFTAVGAGYLARAWMVLLARGPDARVPRRVLGGRTAQPL